MKNSNVLCEPTQRKVQIIFHVLPMGIQELALKLALNYGVVFTCIEKTFLLNRDYVMPETGTWRELTGQGENFASEKDFIIWMFLYHYAHYANLSLILVASYIYTMIYNVY